MATTRYSIPELAAAQAQKHVTVNEALQVIDAAMNLVVKRRDLTDPPAGPTDGDKYIPAIPAGGIWAGHENEIAAFLNGYWIFFAPEIGWRTFDQSTSELLVWNGAAWQDYLDAVTPKRFGVNTAADATNRLAVKSDAVLLSHDDVTPGTGDIRAVMNKAAAENTASLLFQTGYSGRAEVGIVGSDALQLRASTDGASFGDRLEIDPADHTLKVTLNGTERGRWTATGLGIGTASPLAALHLASSTPALRLEDNNAAGPITQSQFVCDDGHFRIQSFTSAGAFVSNDYLIDRNGTGAILHAWRIGNLERMRIDASGNVSIGTTSTTGRMVVEGVGSSGYIAEFRAAAGASKPAILALLGTNSASSASTQAHIAVYQPAGGGAVDAAMDFRLRGSVGGGFGSPGTIMTLLGNGSIGIGTITPDSALHVYKQVNDRTARFQRLGSQYIDIHQDALTNKIASAGKSYSFGTVDAMPLNLITNDINRLTIGATGNVGFGVSSPTSLLDINSNTMRLRNAHTPASATAAGNQGDIAWDTNYIYVCTAANAWKRAALATW